MSVNNDEIKAIETVLNKKIEEIDLSIFNVLVTCSVEGFKVKVSVGKGAEFLQDAYGVTTEDLEKIIRKHINFDGLGKEFLKIIEVEPNLAMN